MANAMRLMEQHSQDVQSATVVIWLEVKDIAECSDFAILSDIRRLSAAVLNLSYRFKQGKAFATESTGKQLSEKKKIC